MNVAVSTVLFVLSVAPQASGQVVVFPPHAVNLTPEHAAAVGVVIAQAYGKVSGADVIGPEATTLKEGQSPAQAAQALGAGEYIEVTAVGLGENGALVLSHEDGDVRVGAEDRKILVQAVRRKASGEKIYGAEMTALTLSDMEDVGVRLARSLYEKVPPEKTQTIRTVTKNESKLENRTAVETVFGFKTSVGIPVVSGLKLEPVGSLAFDWRRESQKYFLEFGFGFLVPADTSDNARGYGGVFAEFGGSYYLTEDNLAPYVGAGIMPRIIGGSRFDTNISFAPYLQGGLMFARESSSRLYADLRVAQNVIGLRHGDTSYYPTEFLLQVGIGW